MMSKVQTVSNGISTISNYIQSIKEITDSLAAGSPVSYEDYVTHVLNGLTSEYDMFVTSIHVRSTDITGDELHNLLLYEEIMLNDHTRAHKEIVDSNIQSKEFVDSSSTTGLSKGNFLPNNNSFRGEN